jgi:hypothetical protein
MNDIKAMSPKIDGLLIRVPKQPLNSLRNQIVPLAFPESLWFLTHSVHNAGPNTKFSSPACSPNVWEPTRRNSPVVNSIFTPNFPLTLPLSPDSGGEGGVRGDFHAAFYATFRLILIFSQQKGRVNSSGPEATPR